MFEYTEDKKFKEDVKAEFWKLGDKSRLCVEKMILVLNDLLDNNEGIFDHIKEAKALEHECDQVKKSILSMIYFGKKEAVINSLLANIAMNMSRISDAVKQACNMIVVIKLQRKN
jgi:uncharacterized protein Yka (UPF0111/DUF47 family)